MNDNATYTVSGICRNCGNDQVTTVEKGRERPRRVECNVCGCYTVETQAKVIWEFQ